MHDHPEHPMDWLIERLVELDACDGYIVLVRDAQTGETDAHGPFDGLGALRAADRTRFRSTTSRSPSPACTTRSRRDRGRGARTTPA